MKKIFLTFIAIMCFLPSSCGNSEANETLFINTPETVIVTYNSGRDVHMWELSQDEITEWVIWIKSLIISPINLEESKTLINYYYGGNETDYLFDVGSADSLEQIAYLECGLYGYLRIEDTWYCVDNPAEPLNKY